MADTLKLTNVIYDPVGQIEVLFEWNGTGYSHLYPSQAALDDAALGLITAPHEAVEVLISYWKNRDTTMTSTADVMDKLLIVDTERRALLLTPLGTVPQLVWTRALLS